MAKTDDERGHRIIRRLAVGGMAEVFLAAPPEGGEPVVLKVLLPHLVKDAEVVAAFRHEAEIGQRLAHPRIVRVRASGTRDGAPCLVLDRVAGATLADVLDRTRAPLPIGAVVAVGLDVLEALAHAHQAIDDAGAPLELVHRDVSPRNVFVDRDGRALLADFGIARSALREGRTRTGAIKGTLGYLSPEQVTGSEVDARADLFALAAVLFEAATGAPFLAAGSDLERLRAAEAPAVRAASASGADPRIDAVLRRALARFPEERHRSAEAMRRALAACATPEEVESGRGRLGAIAASLFAEEDRVVSDPDRGDEPAKREAEPATSPPGGRGLRWALLAALAAGGAVALAWLGRDDGARPIEVPPVGSSSAPVALARSVEPQPESNASAPPAVSSTIVPDVSAEVAAPPRPRAALPAELPRASASARTPDAAAPEASAAAPSPAPPSSSSSPLRAEPAARAASVRAKLDATNARLRDARRRGVDTGGADARVAVALEALMDRRYDDAERELDAIAAALPP